MDTAMDRGGRYDVADDPDLEALLALGIRLMPVKPYAKEPSWKNWQFGRKTPRKNGSLPPYGSSTATVDRDRLLKKAGPGTRFGMPTGQPWHGRYIVVIDIDVKNGALGDVHFAELCAQIGPPPLTATVRSESGGTHIWVWTRACWTDTPKELLPGVEFKRAGQYVVVPPSPGYEWVTSPYGDDPFSGISSWDALDAFLSTAAAAKSAGALVVEEDRTILVPEITAPVNVEEHLRIIAAAKQGSRNATFLHHSGKIGWATALGLGLKGPRAVEARLYEACEANGMTEDYSAAAVERKILWAVRMSIPELNPYLNGTGAGRKAYSVIGRYSPESFSPPQLAVFLDLGSMARAEPHPYSKRFGALRTGFSDWTVREALLWLIAEGLIERGPMVPYTLPNGTKTRDMATFKLTKLGNLVLRALKEAA